MKKLFLFLFTLDLSDGEYSAETVLLFGFDIIYYFILILFFFPFSGFCVNLKRGYFSYIKKKCNFSHIKEKKKKNKCVFKI